MITDFKCCDKIWEIKQKQILDDADDVWEGICLECGHFIRLIDGQYDEEELENIKEQI